jgi:hypothetical protein
MIMKTKNTFFVATVADASSKKSRKNGQKKPKAGICHTFYKI